MNIVYRNLEIVRLPVLLGAFAWTVSSIAAVVTNFYNPNAVSFQVPLLRDFLLELTYDVFPFGQIPRNIFLDNLLPLSSFVTFLACIVSSTFASIGARRGLIIASAMLLLRSLTIVLTIEPNPNESCHADLSMGLFSALLYSMVNVSCGDLMFSGHFTIYWIQLLVITVYVRSHFSYALISFQIFGMVWVYLTRLHYTNDLVIALVITSLAWHLYHVHVGLQGAQDPSTVGKMVRYIDQLDLREEFQGRKKLRLKKRPDE